MNAVMVRKRPFCRVSKGKKVFLERAIAIFARKKEIIPIIGKPVIARIVRSISFLLLPKGFGAKMLNVAVTAEQGCLAKSTFAMLNNAENCSNG
ncbi:MAG: hypothetical protein MUF71_10580 [Candidatus Kapabacteria bacterium]|jgi:hypothetical protein|nr:hypothetical protein [Candidatus Kapabacteria bacterium]